MIKKFVSKALFMLLASSFALVFSGCNTVTKYDRSDIVKLVKEQTNSDNYKVSRKYTAVKGDDGYTDRYWTVTEKKTGFVFHYVDDYSYGGEWSGKTNDLLCDYSSAVLDFVKDEWPEFSIAHIDIEKESYGVCSARLTADFKNKDDINKCYDDVIVMKNFLSGLSYENVDIPIDFNYDFPLRKNISHEIREGDFDSMTSEDITIDDIMKQYVITVLDYRIDDEAIDSFTEEEIKKALKGYYYLAGVYRSGKDNPVEYYDDIVAAQNGEIRYGTLFEIMKREGLNPEGSAWHYSFTGIDNSKYEISYEFNDYEFNYSDDEIYYGYYYLKDGEKVPMRNYAIDHFEVSEIEKMTGLQLKDNIFAERTPNDRAEKSSASESDSNSESHSYLESEYESELESEPEWISSVTEGKPFG